VFFDVGLYKNLSVTASPADWDSLVFQPDPGLPDAGLFDSLSLGLLLEPGDTLGGFSVMFNFLDSGEPGDQFFVFYDPADFSVVAEGTTQLQVVSVPEPSSLALIMAGLMIIAFGMRRKPYPQQHRQSVA